MKKTEDKVINYPYPLGSPPRQGYKSRVGRSVLFVCLFVSLFFAKNWGVAPCYSQVTQSFSYTGSVQTFTVPACVDTLHIKAWGAGGSGGGGDSYPGAVGGGGAFVKSDIAVTAGQIITIIVGGGAGPGGQCSGCAPGGSTGWGNGVVAGGQGGNAGCSGCSGGGGGGGGASAIYIGSSALLVAGAGGGGSGGGQFSSGAIGGGGGQDGNVSPGSCSSPGIAGASSSGNGNSGANKSGDGGGGGAGGGGYNGGTGGGVATGCDCGACGGGGGNSFSAGINTIITNGSGQTGGNTSDPDLPAGTVNGGNGSTKGGDGFVQLIFNGSPDADFSSTTVCNGIATQFTDNTTNTSGTLTSRSWDFGDGSPLNTTVNPSHTYINGGLYNVKLIENNSVGCSDTITKSVQVYYNPTAAFTHSDVCLGDIMVFTNTSSINNSTTIASNLWGFGDGSPTSNLQSPTHSYIAGTFSVLLLTTSADGCVDTASASVNTFDAPQSSFTFSNTCLFDSAKFTNTSVSPVMGNTASWSWDFGDGSPLNTTVWSLSHIYSTPGNYEVVLITHSSNLGCPDTLKDSITVYPMPVADFSFINVCLNEVMNFTDLSIVSSGSIISRSWNFGDSTALSTIQDPGHTYANPGTYPVTLIVTTDNSCKDTITKNVVVHPLPVALFSSVNVCDGTTVQFSNLSTIASTDTIQSWKWNFGDNSPNSTTTNTSHLYAAAGPYSVQLLIVTTFGCPDSITKTSIVNPNPVVLFSASDTAGCGPLCVDFLNSSSIATGSNAASLWTFGDGSPTSNSQNPNHCFVNDSVYSPNSFSVNLKVTSDSGCVSTLTKNNYITVYANPNAAFTAIPKTTTIIDPIISVTDFSIGADSWNWNYGDGSVPLTTSLQAPYTYADTGIYIITLITSTQYGCADTAYETIIIDPEFAFYIPNAFSPDGDGLNDNFIGKGVFIKEFKMSIFDRWGNLIFYSNDKNKPWDGKANHGSEIALRDVYVYSIQVTDFKNKEHLYKGTITLSR